MSVTIMIDGSVKRNRKFGFIHILQSLHVIEKRYKLDPSSNQKLFLINSLRLQSSHGNIVPQRKPTMVKGLRRRSKTKSCCRHSSDVTDSATVRRVDGMSSDSKLPFMYLFFLNSHFLILSCHCCCYFRLRLVLMYTHTP